jgi:hypothetical protein
MSRPMGRVVMKSMGASRCHRCRWRYELLSTEAVRGRAVKANGGRIELESEEEKGSLFRVVLPLTAEDRAVA